MIGIENDQNGLATTMTTDRFSHNDDESAAYGTVEDETSAAMVEGDTTINNDDDGMGGDIGDASILSFNDSVDVLPALAGPEVKRRVAWTRMKVGHSDLQGSMGLL